MTPSGRKKLSIVTPCFNEEGNVGALHARVVEVMAGLPQYDYEHLFIDNDSKDRTQAILREIAAKDRRVKCIFNVRNFGHIRSPYHGILQSDGDATILLVADLQDPPEMIVDFVREWEKGAKVVLGVKTSSEEASLMFLIRTAYYNFVSRVSDTQLVKNNTGFGLYDRVVVDDLRKIKDPYPYFRGLISELGYPPAKIEYRQPARKRGVTSNNFYRLYDIAMLGITSHSKVPLRVATMAGFAMSLLAFFLGTIYLIAKLVFWNEFQLGFAPLLIGVFFFASVQLFFIGLLGEYIGAIHTQVLNRPLVIEKERIGFD
jgi:glycosyltransferase involved in cell wall biosynthesis